VQRHSKQIASGALASVTLGSVLLFVGIVTDAPGQRMIVSPKHPNLENGKAVWNRGCIGCHGADGKGAPETSTVFVRPDTWPDMTRCDQTTPEPDSADKAVILEMNGDSYRLKQSRRKRTPSSER
jgi:Cytochrome c